MSCIEWLDIVASSERNSFHDLRGIVQVSAFFVGLWSYELGHCAGKMLCKLLPILVAVLRLVHSRCFNPCTYAKSWTRYARHPSSPGGSAAIDTRYRAPKHDYLYGICTVLVQNFPKLTNHSSFLPPTCMPPMLKSILTFSPFFSPTFTSPLFSVHSATRPSLAILITLAQAIHHMLTLTLPSGARGKLSSHST